MLQVKFKKLNADAKLPTKGSLDAACFDVYATSIEKSGPGKITMGLGFATEIPQGWKGMIVPRSNLTKHHWIISNSPGQIDADYRGEWKIVFTSTRENSMFPYTIGERVAQIFFEKVEIVQFVEVESLDDSSRGEGGFGSTGLNYVTNTTADVKINTIN
jgi:dUTP pyrophosphatase